MRDGAERRLIVHGSGGHGHVVAATARLLDWHPIFTDDAHGTRPEPQDRCIIAVGDNAARRACSEGLERLTTVKHPRSIVDPTCMVAPGCFIGASAVVNFRTALGCDVIVNTGAIVEHDCRVGAWCHIAPGAVLCGDVTLGEGVLIGANAVVKPGITIAPWTIVGCGAVVIRDVPQPGVYAGNPAAMVGA